MRKQTLAAFVAAVLSLFTMVVPVAAFAQPQPQPPPADPDKPSCGKDPAKADAAIDLMWNDPACRDIGKGNKPTPVPQGQWKVSCGANAIPGPEFGSCICDPAKEKEAAEADDKLEKLDYIDSGHLIKVTACLPTAIKKEVKQQIIDMSNVATKDDIKVINARLDALEARGEVTPEGVGIDYFISTVRSVKGDIEKLQVNNLQLSGGLTGAIGTRNNVMGDVGLTGEVTGWFARRFGLGIQASVGLAFEPADSDQVSPWLFVQGSLLATFGLDYDRHFVLEVGPSFRQTIRPSAEGDGVTGNFFGGSYGGRVDLSIQPGTAPLAIVPFLELGGGPVAGWSDGRKFEGPMFQAFVGLDLKLVGGFLIGDSTK